jgi:UDP-2,4-diacetamido-2,4,6-trideoxy-beta-L-altropyranose hydrolase
MSRTKIYFRADGNNQIGLGHVVRSLALAGMLNSDFACSFVICEPDQSLRKKILEVCQNLIELKDERTHFSEFLSILKGDEIVVLDNYYYDTEYQKSIRNKGCKLVYIDDIHDKHFVADMIINYAPYAVKEDYSGEPYTRYLLGTEYVLLRKRFLDLARTSRTHVQSGNAFICFGGSDPLDITYKVAKHILSFNSINKINIVVGDAYLNYDELKKFVSLRPQKFFLHRGVDDKDMARIMSESNFGIVPYSGVLFECMAVKLPFITGYFVDNQKEGADFFKKNQIGFGVGDFNKHLFSEKNILELSDQNAMMASEYIDGYSDIRIKKAFTILSND